jgi:RNA polymerase sigma factor (sigma-70 family)
MTTVPMRSVLCHLRKAALGPDGGGLTDGQLLQRFLSRRDESAFGVLVRRHGPMVLGVCRRILRNAHDADDAFQATFLVLVRKAASLASRAVVGNWLHGVAYRTALKARSADARRRVKERAMSRPEAVEEDLRPEWHALLDQELTGLPEKYRAPIVLCDLEGKTRREAARLLGCPEGTLSGRLSRARALLARRLAKHGLGLSAGAVAAALLQGTAPAGVPAPLAASTVKAAALVAAGQAAAGTIPAQVVALSEGVLKAMLLTKLRTVTAVVLAVGLLGLGAAAGVYPTRAGEPPAAAEPPAQPALARAADRKQAGESLPIGPLPQTAYVSLFGDHGIQVTWATTVYVPRSYKDPAGHNITYYERVGSFTTRVCPRAAVQVFDTRGRKVEAKKLTRLVQGKILALVAFDGHWEVLERLRLFKDGTLLFILPPGFNVPEVPPPPVGGTVIATPAPVAAAPVPVAPTPLPVAPTVREELVPFVEKAIDFGQARGVAPTVLRVSSKTFVLHYKTVSAPDVSISAVELWYTGDGRTWQKFAEQDDTRKPFTVKVNEEGRHGFTMVVRSGTAFSQPRPRPGEKPEVWVDVNLTPPTVALFAPVFIVSKPGHSKAILRWTATGKNLAARPITLSFAGTANGPATPIATDLANTGKAVWQLPPNLPEAIWIRLHVADRDGNVITVMTGPTRVVREPSRPEGTIIGVEPAKEE